LLYDKWYKVIGEDAPKVSHPAYPAEGKKAKKPGDNWRCKECHGWDYLGKDGGYASGSHFTGIKGISGMKGAATGAIVKVLKNKTHGLANKMDDDDFMDLANFVSMGQLDTDKFIDRASKMPINPNTARGADIYNSVCIKCHGADGTKPKDMGKTLAAQMSNPWEVMHKIMNGHPGQNMPSMRAFGPQTAVDVMSHVLTLPKK